MSLRPMPPPLDTSVVPSIADEWKLQIFSVRTERRQACILESFSRIDRPGLLAVAGRSGDNFFVVVESCNLAGGVRACRVVMAIDPLATRTYAYPHHAPGVPHGIGGAGYDPLDT